MSRDFQKARSTGERDFAMLPYIVGPLANGPIRAIFGNNRNRVTGRSGMGCNTGQAPRSATVFHQNHRSRCQTERQITQGTLTGNRLRTIPAEM